MATSERPVVEPRSAFLVLVAEPRGLTAALVGYDGARLGEAEGPWSQRGQGPPDVDEMRDTARRRLRDLFAATLFRGEWIPAVAITGTSKGAWPSHLAFALTWTGEHVVDEGLAASSAHVAPRPRLVETAQKIGETVDLDVLPPGIAVTSVSRREAALLVGHGCVDEGHAALVTEVRSEGGTPPLALWVRASTGEVIWSLQDGRGTAQRVDVPHPSALPEVLTRLPQVKALHVARDLPGVGELRRAWSGSVPLEIEEPGSDLRGAAVLARVGAGMCSWAPHAGGRAVAMAMARGPQATGAPLV